MHFYPCRYDPNSFYDKFELYEKIINEKLKFGEIVLINANDLTFRSFNEWIYTNLNFDKVKCMFKEVVGACVLERDPASNPGMVSLPESEVDENEGIPETVNGSGKKQKWCDRDDKWLKSSGEGYDRQNVGYNDGYNDGNNGVYNGGYGGGYNGGYNDGYNGGQGGFNNSYNDGYNGGFNVGRAGYNDGYETYNNFNSPKNIKPEHKIATLPENSKHQGEINFYVEPKVLGSRKKLIEYPSGHNDICKRVARNSEIWDDLTKKFMNENKIQSDKNNQNEENKNGKVKTSDQLNHKTSVKTSSNHPNLTEFIVNDRNNRKLIESGKIDPDFQVIQSKMAKFVRENIPWDNENRELSGYVEMLLNTAGTSANLDMTQDMLKEEKMDDMIGFSLGESLNRTQKY